MPLQGDQRALLQLICERGQSYEDIAGLLGGSVDDVRAKARAALTELGGADPDAEVGLTDYLLGQADPIGRADAVRFLQADPESHDLASRIEASLLLLAPAANLPKLPEPRGRPRRAAAPAAGEGAATPARTGDPEAVEAVSSGGEATPGSRQTRLIAAIAGGGVILLFVILAVAGVFSSDDEPATDSSTVASTEDGSTTTTADQTRVTQVALKAVDDSGVAGTADFGIVDSSQLYVDLAVDGLDPKPPEDSTYFVWLMIGPGGYPLNEPLQPDQNGRYSAQLAVPPAVAATVAGQADSVKISLTPVRELAKEAQQAAEEQVPIVPFTGTELATGKIPLAGEGGEGG